MSGVTGLCWYDNQLYWTGWGKGEEENSWLYCIQPDGLNRQRIQSLAVELNGWDCRTRLHRGYLYTGVVETTVENGAAQSTVRICQEIIGGKQPAFTILNKVYDGETYYWFTFYKNEVYIVINYDTIGKGETFSWELYRFDVASRKLELMMQEEDMPWRVADIRFEGDSLSLVQQKNIAGQYELRRVRYDPRENSLEPGSPIALSQPLAAAAGSGYGVGYRITVPELSTQSLPYIIFDDHGEPIREDEITPELTGIDGAFVMRYYGGHDDEILFYLIKQDLADALFSPEWLIRVPLDENREPEILFSQS